MEVPIAAASVSRMRSKPPASARACTRCVKCWEPPPQLAPRNTAATSAGSAASYTFASDFAKLPGGANRWPYRSTHGAKTLPSADVYCTRSWQLPAHLTFAQSRTPVSLPRRQLAPTRTSTSCPGANSLRHLRSLAASFWLYVPPGAMPGLVLSIQVVTWGSAVSVDTRHWRAFTP